MMSTASETYTCLTCHVSFKDVDLQRAHHKSDWHWYNLKRKVSSNGHIWWYTGGIWWYTGGIWWYTGGILFPRSAPDPFRGVPFWNINIILDFVTFLLADDWRASVFNLLCYRLSTCHPWPLMPSKPRFWSRPRLSWKADNPWSCTVQFASGLTQLLYINTNWLID